MRYCQYWGMDYRVEASAPVVTTGDWDKVKMIHDALENIGYEYVIYIDADALIYDVRQDVRNACIKPINAVIFSNPINHANTGVLYIHNTPAARAMISEWLSTVPGKDAGAMSWEQGEFNRLAVEKWQKEETIGYLSNEFNSVDFINPCKMPVVMAWNGYHDIGVRVEKMRRAIEGYNQANPIT